jgi:hypothetical protein
MPISQACSPHLSSIPVTSITGTFSLRTVHVAKETKLASPQEVY